MEGNIVATYKYEHPGGRITCYISDAAYAGVPEEEIERRKKEACDTARRIEWEIYIREQQKKENAI
jgi:hypothetical protein